MLINKHQKIFALILLIASLILFNISFVNAASLPSVETLSASYVSGNAAALNGRVTNNGGGTINERRFDWGTTSSCSDGWTNSTGVAGNYFSYYLTGLTPGRTYYFRAWAHNSAGWSHGNVLSFTTTSLCTNECSSSGTTRCSGNYKQICGNYDADSCLEWCETPDCNSGYHGDDCGSSYCDSFGSNYCKSGNVYHSRTCYNKGCSSNTCFNNSYTDEQLVQTCSNGCSNGVCTVNQIPTCSLSSSPRSGNAPLTVTFNLGASDSDGSIGAWVLDVTGDGNADYSGTGNPPSTKTYTYNNPGSYSVAFIVSDNKGANSNPCLDTINVGSNDPPTASLSASPLIGDAPLTVGFSLNASDSDGYIANWILDYGDGTSDSGNGNPPSTKFHTYANNGTYSAILSVFDNGNVNVFSMKTITVNAKNQIPTCSLSSSPRSGKAPLFVTFSLSGNDPDGSIAAWVLDVTGDGNADYSGNGNPPATKTYNYTNSGSYSVAFMVKDNKGKFSNACLDTINVGSINQPPISSLSADPKTGNAPLNVTFSLGASDSDGSITIWALVTGDGTNYSGNGNPPATKIHTYTNPGTYTAILGISDDDNATNFAMDTIVVNQPLPQATLTLYVHEGSVNGQIIPGARVNGTDASGKYFDVVTDSNGYVTITGSVGTWSFTASMSGYKIVSWSQTINTTCRRDAYIQKEASPISIVITSPLKINPVKSEYDTSDILSAEFKIKNNGASPVTLDVLTVGGRDPDNVVIDFYWQRNITIAPYSNYSYSGNIYSLLSKQGNYHFFCTYRTQEGNWNTNIDLGTGLNVNDREKDIRVVPKYYLTSVPLIDRGGIIIPNGTFPAGEGKMIPIYVPDVINDSNIIRDVDGWITVKNIEKAKFNWDPLKFFLGLFTVGSINSDSPIKSPTGEAVANSFVTLITSGIDASSVAKYKITIQQKGSEQNFRAIIQQGVYPSPVKDLAGAGEQIIINPFDNIYFSNMIAEVFYLEPCSFPYNYWLTASVDSLHENDEYLYYISISNDNRIVSTPKIYAGDKIEVKKISDFNPFNKEVVLELKGDSYTSFFSRPVNNETFKSIKKELSQIDLTLNSTIKIQEHSSGELRVYDSNGNVTGIVNGVIKEEIPFSIYDNESKTVFLSDPSSVYHYNIVGTTAGIYGLTITFTGKESTDKFDAFDIPISNNTVYQYTVDWGVISQGGEGVTLEIDSNGDSLFEKIITEDKELTQAEFIKKTTIPILHCQELQNMKNDLTASYMLQNDINCYETKTWNNGKGFEPIGNLSNKFTGSFNGQNYKIKNLYINRGNEDNIGLFGAVESTNEIKSVGLENSYIIGKNYVGSLIGSLIRGIIDEIYSKDIAVQGYGNEIGGLIGKNENGTIKNTFTTGTVAGNIYVGGLTGFNNGTIENSYSTSDLNGRIFLGGLVGYNYKNGTIKNSFSTGKAPGFVNYNKGSITNSYGYNYTKCAYNNYGSSDCIIKNNKSYFYSKNNQPMTDWDFVNIWKETTNNFIILKNLCKSKVCSELGKECGSWNDGCEKMIDCGACSSGNCISGKCIQKCSDSDGGNNIYVKGTTTGYDTNGNLITREDSCSSRLNRVIEYYCSTTGDEKVIAALPFRCPNGCGVGACVL